MQIGMPEGRLLRIHNMWIMPRYRLMTVVSHIRLHHFTILNGLTRGSKREPNNKEGVAAARLDSENGMT